MANHKGKYPYVKLAFIDQERVHNVLLKDYVAELHPLRIPILPITVSLDVLLDLLQLVEYFDPVPSVSTLTRFEDPDRMGLISLQEVLEILTFLEVLPQWNQVSFWQVLEDIFVLALVIVPHIDE